MALRRTTRFSAKHSGANSGAFGVIPAPTKMPLTFPVRPDKNDCDEVELIQNNFHERGA